MALATVLFALLDARSAFVISDDGHWVTRNASEITFFDRGCRETLLDRIFVLRDAGAVRAVMTYSQAAYVHKLSGKSPQLADGTYCVPKSENLWAVAIPGQAQSSNLLTIAIIDRLARSQHPNREIVIRFSKREGYRVSDLRFVSGARLVVTVQCERQGGSPEVKCYLADFQRSKSVRLWIWSLPSGVERLEPYAGRFAVLDASADGVIYRTDPLLRKKAQWWSSHDRQSRSLPPIRFAPDSHGIWCRNGVAYANPSASEGLLRIARDANRWTAVHEGLIGAISANGRFALAVDSRERPEAIISLH